MKKLMISILFTLFSMQAFAHNVATNEIIDINKFIGKWYAVSSLPLFFSRGCTAQTAEYGIINESKISVLNTCFKPGKKKWIKGQAEVTNKETNAELVVTFNAFFTRLFRVKGDYNIIKIDPNYDYVIVGSNNRKSLWIMSRTPSMDENVYNEYVEYAKSLNFPVNKLVKSKF